MRNRVKIKDVVPKAKWECVFPFAKTQFK